MGEGDQVKDPPTPSVYLFFIYIYILILLIVTYIIYLFQFLCFLEPAKQIIRSTKGWYYVGFCLDNCSVRLWQPKGKIH